MGVIHMAKKEEWEKCPNPSCNDGKVYTGGPIAVSSECTTCHGHAKVKKK
jgi:hypothetical protein